MKYEKNACRGIQKKEEKNSYNFLKNWATNI